LEGDLRRAEGIIAPSSVTGRGGKGEGEVALGAWS